jgi:hypothetical protein
MDYTAITICAASDDDYESSYQVKEATESELIARTFGWYEPFQRHFHLQEWNERRPSLIRLGGDSLGTVAITEGDGYIEVGQFFIRPEYQNRG